MNTKKKSEVGELAERINVNRVVKANLPDLAEAVLRVFGGARGLAAEIKDAYDGAAPNSPVKARLLTACLDLVRHAGGAARGDVEEMSPEELENTLKQLLG